MKSRERQSMLFGLVFHQYRRINMPRLGYMWHTKWIHTIKAGRNNIQTVCFPQKKTPTLATLWTNAVLRLHILLYPIFLRRRIRRLSAVCTLAKLMQLWHSRKTYRRSFVVVYIRKKRNIPYSKGMTSNYKLQKDTKCNKWCNRIKSHIAPLLKLKCQ
jgi:hypothetical protein